MIQKEKNNYRSRSRLHAFLLCFGYSFSRPLFLRLKTDMSKFLTATSFLSGKREERRRGKNKNGKYNDWKSFTEYTEQF